MKKEEIGKKMHREECDKCGSMKHKTDEHKGQAVAKKSMKPITEGDFHRYSNPEDKFSKKDMKKEKADWKEKGGGDYAN